MSPLRHADYARTVMVCGREYRVSAFRDGRYLSFGVSGPRGDIGAHLFLRERSLSGFVLVPQRSAIHFAVSGGRQRDGSREGAVHP